MPLLNFKKKKKKEKEKAYAIEEFENFLRKFLKLKIRKANNIRRKDSDI